jgi:hypothetical protein
MNLLDRSETLASEIKDLEKLGAIADQAEAIRSRAAQFETALGTLRISAGSARQLRQHGVQVEADTSSAQGVSHFIGQLLEAVKADPAAILSAKDVQPKMLGPVGKLATSVQNGADQAWARHIRQQLPAVSTELLDALSRVTALRPKVEHFRGLRDQALSAGARAPTKEAEFDVAKVLISQCDQAWRELDAEGIPKEVLSFFRAAASLRGADLASLKPEVLTWLQGHSLVDAFGIRTR